ncbi:unnamed protein product [Mytilus coruscus]|uniref:FLYWCH-type domain-containing protein n=1 Tax=Mytilus coruscus TaxID=42192 RepID=A0A6J8AL92_MYTCO|nr:unnamed protein product [Mytilus coruscus]
MIIDNYKHYLQVHYRIANAGEKGGGVPYRETLKIDEKNAEEITIFLDMLQEEIRTVTKLLPGISITDYRLMVNEEVDIIFHCAECVRIPQDMEVEAKEVFNNFKSNWCIFDIEDPELTDSFVEDRPVTFEVVENGTMKRAKKLVSSDGFSYTVKSSTSKTVNWRCSVRNKKVWCKATVMQRGNNFVVGATDHIHASDPGITKRTKIRVGVLTEASRHAYKSAGDIVDEQMREHVTEDDFNLPKPDNLTRAANRLRQKLRPAEPKDIDFEIDREYLACDNFLVGDLTVDTARHVMFSSPTQQQILQKARRWYLDGTFKVVRTPFTQLFTVHAFLQKEDSIKQVPLVFVLMSHKKEERLQGIMRKVAKLGLKTAYDSKKSVHLFIRKLLALPYLPSDHIRPAFTEMLQTTATASPQIKQLMTYLQRVPGSTTQSGLFNSGLSIRLSVRTNNDVEGWHRRFNGKAAHNHLHFYKIVPAFQQEAKTVSITQQLQSEQQLSRYQRDTYKQLQGRLTSLWDQYEEDSIRTSDFLRSVGHLYAPLFHNQRPSQSPTLKIPTTSLIKC